MESSRTDENEAEPVVNGLTEEDSGPLVATVQGGWLRPLLMVVVPLAAIFFGAGRETWSQGLAVGLAGAALVLAPPKRRLPLAGVLALLAVLLAPLTGFLPVSWAGGIPEWRQELVSEWGLNLGKSLSAAPAVTFEAWLVMLCCGAWLWHSLGQGFSERQRRLALRWLMVGGVLLSLVSILEFLQKLTIPWWPRDPTNWGMGFGPFANRNHISSIAAITALLAAAVVQDAVRQRSRWWLIALPCFLVPLIAIFVNTSRGGLLLFFVGMTLWVGTSAMRKGFFKKLAVSASVIIAVASVVMVAGGNLSQRLRSEDSLQDLSQDYRVRLFGETMKLAESAPWTGIGLGNFNRVFPQVSDLRSATIRFLHPESDVLWFFAEVGIIGCLALAAMLAWLWRATGPWVDRERVKRGRSDRRLRRAAGIAACLSLLHSLVDVPNHGVGYFLFTGLLLGLAVRPRYVHVPAGWHAWVFRAAGVGLIAAGIGWIGIARDKVRWPLPSTAHRLHAQALVKGQEGLFAEATDLVDQALQITPLNYRLYYLRAQLRLSLGQSPERALQDFGRARALEPHLAKFCYEEGKFWLAYQPQYAAIPWREWIRRHQGGADSLWGAYRQMLQDAEPYPGLRATLWHLAETPSMKLNFLLMVQDEKEWQNALNALLEQQPGLESFSADQFRELFRVWLAKGNRDQLVSHLEKYPTLQEHGWRILAEEHARRGNFQAAYEVAAKFLPVPSRPVATTTDIAALERAFVMNPSDPRPAVELYYALRRRGEAEDAAYALKKALEMPNAPNFLRRELADMEAEKGDYRKAWEYLREAADQP